jgi:mannose-1-phosphate guanylyltransferase
MRWLPLAYNPPTPIPAMVIFNTTNKYRKANIHKAIRFTEKPDKKTALSFIQDGSYLWNAGIFIWKAADILEAFQAYAPQVYHLFKAGEAAMNGSA